MRCNILTICLLIGTISSYSQAVPPDAKCPPEQVFSKAEFEPVYKPGIDSMKIFFSDLTFSPTTKGQIELSVIVCYNGDVTSGMIKNSTNTELDQASLKRWISLMTGWKPGIQNGRYIGFAVTILLTIDEGTVTRVKCTIGSNTKTSS